MVEDSVSGWRPFSMVFRNVRGSVLSQLLSAGYDQEIKGSGLVRRSSNTQVMGTHEMDD